MAPMAHRRNGSYTSSSSSDDDDAPRAPMGAQAAQAQAAALVKDERRIDLGLLICGPFLRWIPRSVHPNTITLINHGCNWLLLGLALVPREWFLGMPHIHIGIYSICALVNFVTMMLDCLDGMHARATKQTSKLGELLDHFLDSIHVPMIAGGTAYATGMTDWHLALVLPANILLYGSQLIVYHYKNDFISTSGIEAQIAVSGVYLFCAGVTTQPPNSWWRVVTPYAAVLSCLAVAIRLHFIYFAHFSPVMWRKYGIYLFYNVILSVCLLLGTLTFVQYVLVMSFLSLRITGMYVLLSIVKKRYWGTDHAVWMWAVAIIGLFLYTKGTPWPLTSVAPASVLALPYVATFTVQDLLPYGFCLHMMQRAARDFMSEFKNLKNE